MRAVSVGVAVVALGACSPEAPTVAPVATDRELPVEILPWSPERADLLFMSNRDGNAEIYLKAAGSDAWQNLTGHPAEDNWPEWSPDGARIAFQSDRSGNLDIWVMDADGSNLVQLTDNAAPDYLPTWSPDGREISFASWRLEPGETAEAAVHHYVMNADGSGQTRLFADAPGTATAAAWAPDGQSFLVARQAPDGQGADIFQLDRQGGVVRRFTEDEPTDGAPFFAPDGSEIAFHADRGETSALVLLRSDGTFRRTLLADGQQYYPRWSPDSKWLVYTAANPPGSENLDVMATPADGSGTPVVLAASPGRDAEGRWRPDQP